MNMTKSSTLSLLCLAAALSGCATTAPSPDETGERAGVSGAIDDAPGLEPSAGINKLSCQGRCLEPPKEPGEPGCSCSILCPVSGNCCKDYGEICEGVPGDSCAGSFRCGGTAPSGCSCKTDCAQQGNCCADVLEACSCQGSCGAQPTSGCFCSLDCWQFGVCCHDAFESCFPLALRSRAGAGPRGALAGGRRAAGVEAAPPAVARPGGAFAPARPALTRRRDRRSRRPARRPALRPPKGPRAPAPCARPRRSSRWRAA